MDMERALGCIVGALVGDAAGATLEFRRSFTEADIDSAMHMCGGGALGVGKGQVTDDGELTLALAGALVGKEPFNGFPINEIADGYTEWYKSMPFDCGGTCKKAFYTPQGIDGGVGWMLGNAARYNMLSEANGALMRCTPIPIWCWKETRDVVAQYARMDAMLSHPSQVCQDCNAVYCVALWSLIKGDGRRAVEETREFVEFCVKTPVVKEWFLGAGNATGGAYVGATRNIGHVRHAFTMAMRLLERPPASFSEGIRWALGAGGDTDTNAAICGGLLGAMFGYQGIPSYMKTPVLSYRYDKENKKELIGHARPDAYRATNALGFVENVFGKTYFGLGA